MDLASEITLNKMFTGMRTKVSKQTGIDPPPRLGRRCPLLSLNKVKLVINARLGPGRSDAAPFTFINIHFA